MRQRRVHSRLLLALPVLLLALAASPVEVAAVGGHCGGTTPCECGDLLTTNRTLVNGVDPITTAVCPGDGLILEASLDLGGTTVQGDGTGAGVRLFLVGGITVTNGTIAGFGAGIDGEDTTGNRFTDLHLTGNQVGIALGEANNNVIERNIVSRIRCGGGGIAVSGGLNIIRFNRVEFNHLAGGAPAGIAVSRHLGKPGANTVSRNIVRRNERCGEAPVAGVAVEDNGATIELNRSEGNAGDGFIIGSVDPEEPGMTVRRNVAVRNDGNGFTILGTDTRLDRNAARYNGGFGIEEDAAAGLPNTYLRNVCAGNALGDSDPPGLCD